MKVAFTLVRSRTYSGHAGRLVDCLVLMILGGILTAAGALKPMAETTMAQEEPTRLFLAAIIGKPAGVRRARAREVLGDVEAKLEAAPLSVELHLLKVAALGSLARASNFQESLANRYGSRSGSAIETLLSLAPSDPWARALSGIWNLEVKRRGGGLGAFILGASADKGIRDLEQAQELLPRDPAIPFAFGVSLLSLDAQEYARQAAELLEEAKKLAAARQTDVISPVVGHHSERLLRLLEAGRATEAGKLSRELM